MKVCIYGAGAIGGHIGGHLARSGAEVSLIARGPHLEAIQRNGLRSAYPIGEPDGSESPRLVKLVEAMTAGGLHAPLQRDIRGQIWTKMINSLCWNQAAFLTEAINGEFEGAPDVVEVVRRMMVEMEAVAEALGASIPVPMEKRITMTVKATEAQMRLYERWAEGRAALSLIGEVQVSPH